MTNVGQYSRCTGLMIFYDEPIELIAAHVSSLKGVVDHLVAVDGAWMYYPDAKPASDPQQMRLISEICSSLHIGLTAHTPDQVWVGNEVEKRNFSLRLAEAVTVPGGWYYSGDTDEVVTYVDPNWFEVLDGLSEQGWGAMEVGIRETREIPGAVTHAEPTWQPIRNVYRAFPGMTYGPAHYVLHAVDTEADEVICVRGNQFLDPIPAYDGVHLLKFDHRQERPEWRTANKIKYYERRGKLGFEDLSRVT